MAVAPRKDIKNAPIRAKEPAEAVKQAVPAVAPKAQEGGAPDVFERVVPATGAAAAAAAAQARATFAGRTEPERTADDSEGAPPSGTPRAQPTPSPVTSAAARDLLHATEPATGAAAAAAAAREAGAGRLEPKLTPPSAGQQGAGEKGDSGATPVAAVKPAATAAADIREAAKGRVESAIKEEPDDPADGPKEPRTDLAGVPAGIADLSGGGDKGVSTRTGESGDGGAAPAPFRDSGRAALTAQVDALFPDADPTSSSGGGGAAVGGTGSVDMGRKGTPADLGMTGDETSIGMDVFDTVLPATGVVSASGELGILQGMLPTSGADPNATPSVAAGKIKVTQIDTEPDGAPVEDDDAVVDGKPVEESIIVEGLTDVVEALVEAAPYVAAALGVAALGAAIITAPALGLGLAATGVAVMVTPPASEGSTGSPGTSQPVDPETAGHPEITPGYMAWRAAGRARLGLGTPLDGEGDVDPAREGTDTATSGGGPTDNVTVGMMDTAWREFLVGQPGEGRAAGGGQIDPSGGTRPGDMGNIDFGPDSTGAWTGEPRTDEPEDALDSLNRPRLSVEDAKQDDSSDSEEEEDNDEEEES